MHLLLVPTAAGFDYRANGGSRLGPFTSNGRILLPSKARDVISIAALNVGGTHASGDLRSDPGGFTGALAVAGGGLDGTLGFAPVGDAQKIEAHLTRQRRRFPGVFAVRSGRARRHHHPRRRAHDDRRRGRRARLRWRRHHAGPAHRQRPAGQRQRARSARRSPAAAAPRSISRRSPTSRPTGSG